MYREYPPDISLSNLIETYWVADGLILESSLQRVLPDGCVDIIFDFANNDGTGRLQTGLPELVGTMTSLLEVSYKVGQIQMMGIRFTPGGITAFTNIPVYEFTNQHIDLPLSEMLFDYNFYEQLPDIEEIEKRIGYINRYLLARLPRLYVPDERIKHSVSFIRDNNGQLPVKKIAEEVCLCERQFERKFKTAIGISPKMFSNITRFQFARQYIKTHVNESLFTASIFCGYHDLAHMNKDFQRFGHISPSEVIG